MIDEVTAARDAAYAYQPRNDGEEPHVLFIRAAMDDAHLRASMLDDIAGGHEQLMRVRAAEAELAAAQAGTPAAAPGEDSQAQPAVVVPEAQTA